METLVPLVRAIGRSELTDPGLFPVTVFHTALPESMIRDALTVLWDRTCRLYTSHLLARDDPDWDNPFFSNERLRAAGKIVCATAVITTVGIHCGIHVH